jgi:uncharacterized protein (UPF0332 family)
MLYNTEKMLELGLLRRIPASRKKAEDSIHAAGSWLDEAESNLRGGTVRSCLLSSYLAMFHAGRALLYADGFREKSHFAVARYLEDRYVSVGKLEASWVELLDYYRETRNEDQYGTVFITSVEEAQRALESARAFVKRLAALLQQTIL